MADYFSPTVIRPDIPDSDMTPLERLLLTSIFGSEPHEDRLYFFSEQSPNDMPDFEVRELRAALLASKGTKSRAATFVSGQLKKAGRADDEIYLDMSIISWELLFQDIVRRSSTLKYVTAVSAWTCSKMRPDGFGGMAVLITAKRILGKSTEDLIVDFLNKVDPKHLLDEGAS